jgi:hypothetical protein
MASTPRSDEDEFGEEPKVPAGVLGASRTSPRVGPPTGMISTRHSIDNTVREPRLANRKVFCFVA